MMDIGIPAGQCIHRAPCAARVFLYLCHTVGKIRVNHIKTSVGRQHGRMAEIPRFQLTVHRLVRLQIINLPCAAVLIGSINGAAVHGELHIFRVDRAMAGHLLPGAVFQPAVHGLIGSVQVGQIHFPAAHCQDSPTRAGNRAYLCPYLLPGRPVPALHAYLPIAVIPGHALQKSRVDRSPGRIGTDKRLLPDTLTADRIPHIFPGNHIFVVRKGNRKCQLFPVPGQLQIAEPYSAVASVRIVKGILGKIRVQIRTAVGGLPLGYVQRSLSGKIQVRVGVQIRACLRVRHSRPVNIDIIFARMIGKPVHLCVHPVHQ